MRTQSDESPFRKFFELNLAGFVLDYIWLLMKGRKKHTNNLSEALLNYGEWTSTVQQFGELLLLLHFRGLLFILVYMSCHRGMTILRAWNFRIR